MFCSTAVVVLGVAFVGGCSAQWGWYPGGGGSSSAAAAAASASGFGGASASAAAAASSGGGYGGGGYYPYYQTPYYNPYGGYWGSPYFGYYCDNTDPKQIKTKQDACLGFIELNQADQPLKANETGKFIVQQIIHNNSTEARIKRDQLRKEANVTGSPDASTFQCCHVVFAKEFFPKSTEKYEVPVLPGNLTCQMVVDKLYFEMSGQYKEQAKKATTTLLTDLKARQA